MQYTLSIVTSITVTVVCIVDGLEGRHFRLCDVTQPSLNMHNDNNAIHCNFVCIFVDSLVENS